MPRLTIGLPVYNGERHLAESIESILSQSFGDFVLLVGDNASTDGTPDIVQRYAALDARVRLHRQDTNTGLVANHNRLFAMADTPLFKWAAADDAMEPTCIERCVAELDAHPEVVLAYARTVFVDCDGAVLDKRDPGWDLREPDPAARLHRVVMGGHWMNSLLGVARTAALRRASLFPNFPDGDFILLGELALLGPGHEVPEMLYRRRLHRDAPNQQADRLVERLRYLAGDSRRIGPPTLTRYRAHLRTIREASLPPRRKLGLVMDVARALWWRRGRIAFERRTIREATRPAGGD